MGCNKTHDNSSILSPWRITNVEETTTRNINKTVPLIIYWPYTSGSWDNLDTLNENRIGYIVTIKAYGHSASGICTDDAGISTKPYNFLASTAGIYQLNFFNPDSTFIPFTITIN